MRFRTSLLTLGLCALLPAAAAAQAPASSPIHVAPYVGAVLDTPDDWLLFGGEARLALERRPIELNPRITFNPFEGGSMMQIDVNLLRHFDLVGESRLRPFVGIGGAFNRFSFEDVSDNALGLNLVTGVRIKMQPESRFEPFVETQYTIIRDQGNLYTIVVGATFQLK